MKPVTSRTNAASGNGTSAGFLAGRHHQAFTLMKPFMRQTLKNLAHDNDGGIGIRCQTESVAYNPVTSEKDVKRMNRSKRNSSSCLGNRRFWSQRIRGFTLIELMVVISLIILLMGILVPVYGKIVDITRLIKCRSNLEEIYIALLMYANDNNGQCPNPNVTGQIPISVKFKEALLPYVKWEEIFWCPNDLEKSKHPGGSYGWRVTRDPKTSIAGVRLDLLRHPSKVMIAGELSHGCHKSEMINVLYADGHVDLVTRGEFIRNMSVPLKFK